MPHESACAPDLQPFEVAQAPETENSIQLDRYHRARAALDGFARTQFSMDDDARLVALLDGELDADSRAQLLARIENDHNLRNRYLNLREAGASIAAAFDVLLERAPLFRLRPLLPPESDISAKNR
jgi:hypothetical protein